MKTFVFSVRQWFIISASSMVNSSFVHVKLLNNPVN